MKGVWILRLTLTTHLRLMICFGRPGLYHTTPDEGFSAQDWNVPFWNFGRLHFGLKQLTADNTPRDLKIQCPYLMISLDNVKLQLTVELELELQLLGGALL
jgi:hypothetical protein